MDTTKWQQLLDYLQQASLPGYAANLTNMDRETMMPLHAGPGRAEVSAWLTNKAMAGFRSQKLGDLITSLQADKALLPYQVKVITRIAEIHRRAKALSPKLVTAWSKTTTNAWSAWTEAKAKSDFALFLPNLKAVIALAREKAAALGYDGHPLDALMWDFEPGMTAARAGEILLPLQKSLSDLTRLIAEKSVPDETFMRGTFSPELQAVLARVAVSLMGFDFRAGRIDPVRGHPQTGHPGWQDVRMTVRPDPLDMREVVFGAMHECGHALLEQGVEPALERIWMDTGISMAIHESQSRLWENMVGRSQAFWAFFLPIVQGIFPQFCGVPVENFWRAINIVRPSLIRVEADEVTYLLHILLRFELERAMLSGDLKAEDLPGVWNEKMQQYLGLTPPDDAHGCLQDIHWSIGYFGYFPSYALGNLMAAQLWNKMGTEADIEEEIGRGNLRHILGWLRQRVHPHGWFYEMDQMAKGVTGEPVNPAHFIFYLNDKYTQVYDL